MEISESGWLRVKVRYQIFVFPFEQGLEFLRILMTGIEIDEPYGKARIIKPIGSLEIERLSQQQFAEMQLAASLEETN